MYILMHCLSTHRNSIRIRKKLQFLLFITAVFLATGCQKGEDLSWGVGVSGPLLKTRLDLFDIIPDSVLTGDCQNWAYLDFKQDVYTLDAATLIDVSQSITKVWFAIPATIMLQPGQAFISSLEETTFGFEDAEIRKIKVDKGLVSLSLLNPLTQPVVCTYALPGSDNGQGHFAAEVTIPAATGSTPGHTEVDADISGYTILLTGASGNAVNTLKVQIDARVAQTAQPVQVTPFDTLRINASFKELTLESAFGYFGQHQITPGKKKIAINTFDFFTAGTLQLDSASAAIRISNGTGMDIRLQMRSMVVRNTKTNLSVTVNDPFMAQPVYISRGSIQAVSGMVVPTEYAFVFDPATVKTMLELLPDELEYEMDMEINPMGNVSFGNDFITSSDPLKATFELSFPFSIHASGLTISEDVDFSFSAPSLQEGKLYLIADNRFPFDATLNLRLLDKDGNEVDSLLPAGVISAGNLLLPDLIQSVRTVIGIPCDAARLERLHRSKKILVNVVLDTKPNGVPVRLKTDYDLNLVLSANLKTPLAP